jgi:lipopolysaccharide export system permease protein
MFLAANGAFIFKNPSSSYTEEMLIISRIIVKEWLKNFFGAVVVLFMLVTVADLINGFLQSKEISRILLEYSLKMPDFMGKLLPICALVSSLFTFNRLKSHAELISILAAGYSFRRIYILIGGCALFVSVLQFLNLGFIEPYANKIKRQQISKSVISEGRYLTRSSIEGGKFWYKSQNYFASFSYFDRRNSELRDIEIFYFNQNHHNEKILKAQKATYRGANSWELSVITELSSIDSNSFPIQRNLEKMSITLGEIPEDFWEFEADLTTLSFFKLAQFIRRMSKTGINISEYQIILLNKIFLSFICFVFSLIPVSSIFQPNRRVESFGKSVVKTLLISVVFWVLYSSALAFGNSGTVPAWFATGIVPMVFFSFVIWTYLKNRKLSI